MWKCHKCGKPVYFAERKQSLGYDWHPECLRCEECGKRLNPGLHAEHKGVPYCHVPCYGALFGPQLFGHGTRVESHKSFGIKGTPRLSGPSLPRDHLESKLKVYNAFFNNKSHEIRCREVNERLVLEGALRVCWGVQGVIHLKEDDDQRTVITVRKRNSCRYNSSEADSDRHGEEYYHDLENVDVNDTGIDLSTSSIVDGAGDSTDVSESMSYDTCSLSEDVTSLCSASSSKDASPEHRSHTLPSKLIVKQLDWDEIDELLQVERRVDDAGKLYQTMPSPLPSLTSLEQDTYASTALTQDFKSLDLSTTSSSSTITTPSAEDVQPSDIATTTTTGEYLTPNSTLKNVDYDLFKQQMHEEYINNSNRLQSVNEYTLKSNQPIDPSRINDSLKLYSENMMSKSFSGTTAAADLRVCPTTIQYQTLGAIDQPKFQDIFGYARQADSSARNYVLQKSGSASSRTISHEHDNWMEKGLNRSKSGPNWYEHNPCSDSDNCDTLKPSTIRKNHVIYNIKMDCYSDDCAAVTATSDILKAVNGNAAGPTTPSSSNTMAIITSTTTTSDTASQSSHGFGSDDCNCNEDGVVLRRPKTGSTAIKRRSGNKRSRAKLKRRCSINGHFYNRETSFFTPPRGSQMSVWVTSLVSTQDVINLLLEKYKVESRSENFALFIVRDNGEQKRLKNDDYPLIARIMLGPHEDVARLFLMDSQSTAEISCEVAQFLNLSIPECRSILDRYNAELDREVLKIKEKYAEMKRRIVQRMESLKVRL